jgi:hypothetical protein
LFVEGERWLAAAEEEEEEEEERGIWRQVERYWTKCQ